MNSSQDWFADHLGPVELITFTLPTTTDASPWESLLQAVDRGMIHILDLEFVRRNADDEVEFLDAEELPGAPAPLAAFAGADSGLVDDEDAVALLNELADGEVAVVLVVEHVGLLPALLAFESAGSRLLLDGGLGLDDLATALDSTETDD